MLCTLCGATYVVQSTWCNICGAIYAVSAMWYSLCGALCFVQCLLCTIWCAIYGGGEAATG
eukprot:3344127-Pyramimonas_sp.AAC.1